MLTVNVCSIELCENRTVGRGWCDKHYRRFRRYGDPLGLAPPRIVKICQVEDCEKASRNHGFCSAHDRRFRLYGDPLGTPEKREPTGPTLRTCSVEGCEASSGKVIGGARGWCNMHYTRWARWGDPLGQAPVTPRSETCMIAGCERANKTRGYCTGHYSNVLRHGTPTPRKRGEVRDGRKVCSSCGLDLDVDKFGTRREKIASACRACEQLRGERIRRQDPESARKWGREYGRRNAGKRRDAARRRRARQRTNAAVELVDTETVMNRSRWTCGICDNRILRSRQWPDRLSASMDHILPLALGGSHTYDNLQAAHLGCNMAKGARSAPTDFVSVRQDNDPNDARRSGSSVN